MDTIDWIIALTFIAVAFGLGFYQGFQACRRQFNGGENADG